MADKATSYLRSVALAALISANLGGAAYAWDADCTRWADTEDSIRCFDCLRSYWDGHATHYVNTCRPRRIPPHFPFFPP